MASEKAPRPQTSSTESTSSGNKTGPTHVEDIHGESPEVFQERYEYYSRYPNRWSRYRQYIREPAAEMLGTMTLILFGTGVDCQVVLSMNTGVAAFPRGDWLSINFGWACGAALGVWVSGGISGGHCNPVVTLCMAVYRGFPWKKVPIYILGQLLGAWIGGFLVYANYFHAINIYEGGDGVRTLKTGALFSTYSAAYMPAANCFFDEFLGAFILMLVVFAVSDKRNGPPPPGLVPLVIFIVILGIGAAFGMQTGYAINPARDLGPRLMTAMVGYGRQVFNFRDQYWIWTPILGSLSGGLVACFVYDVLIFTGDESYINSPSASARRHFAHARHAERPMAPAGFEPDHDV
ncbi:aquaporin [Auriscalpium vulgare]|uniref:Aquaporin n=1 Tax=Auriscalpium vulgare TaxID=40419 RepID=A0ACB8RDJ5_9AGAM|nr:aquaporin [Auriscalpium vulgare]